MTRLLKYTGGAANEAINGCILIGGSTGYQHAKSILNERFGKLHLVSETVVRNLRGNCQLITRIQVIRMYLYLKIISENSSVSVADHFIDYAQYSRYIDMINVLYSYSFIQVVVWH